LGPGFTARFLLRRARIADVEERVRSLTGCTFHTVPDCAPEFAIDIDAAEDLEFILRNPERSDP
jgi:hypothetical protein